MGNGKADSICAMRSATAAWPRLETARVFSPLRVHIGRGNAPAKFPRHTFTAVRQGVGFNKARPAQLPVLGANGDLTAQQCAGTRAAAPPAAQSDPAGRQ